MSVFRGNGLKFFALSAALFAATAPSRSAFATLGEPEVTVQNDVTLARATIKSSQERDSYRVHEIQLPSGTVMREFVGLDGKVFAVTWQGPTRPDLRQALGQYFDAYLSAPRSKFADRRHVQVQQGDLIV